MLRSVKCLSRVIKQYAVRDVEVNLDCRNRSMEDLDKIEIAAEHEVGHVMAKYICYGNIDRIESFNAND